VKRSAVAWARVGSGVCHEGNGRGLPRVGAARGLPPGGKLKLGNPQTLNLVK
jgi:hypothetical protein